MQELCNYASASRLFPSWLRLLVGSASYTKAGRHVQAAPGMQAGTRRLDECGGEGDDDDDDGEGSSAPTGWAAIPPEEDDDGDDDTTTTPSHSKKPHSKTRPIPEAIAPYRPVAPSSCLSSRLGSRPASF